MAVVKCLLWVSYLVLLCGASDGEPDKCSLRNPCKCIDGNFTINLTEVDHELKGKNITPVDPEYHKYTFLLSLCHPILCNFTNGLPGNKTAAACQYNHEQDVFMMLGQQSTISWSVDPTEEADFYIMYTRGEPIEEDIGRRTKVQFIIDDSVEKPVVAFDQELADYDKDGYPVSTYVFNVTLPHSPPHSLVKLPDEEGELSQEESSRDESSGDVEESLSDAEEECAFFLTVFTVFLVLGTTCVIILGVVIMLRDRRGNGGGVKMFVKHVKVSVL